MRGVSLACLTVFVAGLSAPGAGAQSWRDRIIKGVGCGAGATVGLAGAKVLAQLDARRYKLSPEQTRERERSYRIGLAMYLCAGGAALAGTVHGKLSERGRKNREAELQLALDDANPRTYTDPENPNIRGRITQQETFTEGESECRIMEDYATDGEQGESILQKYCRPPDGEWTVQTT